jgi:hypothetical protein
MQAAGTGSGFAPHRCCPAFAGCAGGGGMSDTKQIIYAHGGSRIYRENADGSRDLIADTYGDEKLALALFSFIVDHYNTRIP